MGTIKDVAKRSGLGLATVSKYINGGNVREENKVAIEAAINDVGFEINTIARSLRSGRTQTIGVILPRIDEIFRTTILSHVEKVLRENGYSLIFVDCQADKELEHQAVQFLLSKQVDGIISIPFDNDGAYLLPAIEKNIPVVLIEYTIDGLKNKVNAVLVDNIKASEAATQLLIDAGHKEIGIILGTEHIAIEQERLFGYKQALEKNKIEFQERLVCFTDYTVKNGYEKAKYLITTEKPSALFAANYYMTMGAIMATYNMNLSIPKDISFVGFDRTPFTEIFSPKLTFVEQPLEELAVNAAEIMLNALKNENKPAAITKTLLAHIQLGDSIAKHI